MNRLLKGIAIALGVLAAALVLAVGTVYAVSGARMRKTYDVQARPLAIPSDSAAVARGEHLAMVIAKCGECHGADLGGKLAIDAGPVGQLYAPNLTRGRGGVAAQLTDADWARAIRHGVRPDGTSLIFMPSEDYVWLNDADLESIIAYVKQLPPVDREMPRPVLRPLGRALMVAGQLPVLSAEKAAAVAFHATVVPPGPTKEYGQYLANIGGCTGCHGPGLSGGRVPGTPPELPPASNLTPAGIGSWSEADFVRALREGKRPDGTTLNEFMPWKVAGKMTDDEIRAVWLYLQSIPAKEYGNR